MADRDTGAARRRRERRMRSWWHHEQVSIAAAVAAALHHSARPVTYKAPRGRKTATEEVEKTTHNVPRHQKTPLPGRRPGVLKDPAPQGGAVTCPYVAAAGPLVRGLHGGLGGRPRGADPPPARPEEEGGGGRGGEEESRGGEA